MSPEADEENLNRWLEEFSRMADDRLGDGSACDQVHPIVERWYTRWLQSEIDEPRSSVLQALACLTTEVLNSAPESILDVLMENCDEDEVADWLQHLLFTGMSLQKSLDSGDLDDL